MPQQEAVKAVLMEERGKAMPAEPEFVFDVVEIVAEEIGSCRRAFSLPALSARCH